MNASPNSISQLLCDEALATAEGLSNSVTETRVLQSGRVVTGVVNDGGSQRVYIQLDSLQNPTEIDGECSCELGENCGHIAAVLLQAWADHDNSPATVRSIDVRPTAIAVESQHQQQLFYKLDIAPVPPANTSESVALLLSVWVGQDSRHCIPFEWQVSRSDHYPRYVQAGDQTVLNQLQALPQLIRGVAGASLLESCLATGRVYFQSFDDEPLVADLSPAQLLQAETLAVTRVNACLRLFTEEGQAWGQLLYRYNDTLFNAHALPDKLSAGQSVVYAWHVSQLFAYERDMPAEAQLRSQIKDFSWQQQGLSLPGKQAWLNFMLLGLGSLERSGWELQVEDNFPYRIAEANEWYGELNRSTEANGQPQDWFALELGVMVDGVPVNILPLLVAQLSQFSDQQHIEDRCLLRLDDGRFVALPMQRVTAILDTLVELYDQGSLETDSSLKLPTAQLSRLAELQSALADDEAGPLWTGEDELQALAQRLGGFEGITALSPPASFTAVLRDYQKEGLGWLQFLRQCQVGGILADDMGLGKTVQTLAHISIEKSAGRLQRPCLIVAPTSLMANWRAEAKRFAPELTVRVLHGPKRHQLFAGMEQADIILTTYPLLHIDSEPLARHEYAFLILDEAQTIKNRRSKVSQAAREIVAEHRLCLTGTPMENHLGELWSLFDFLQPGLLGTESSFQRQYRYPIERDGNQELAAALSRRLAPFILRRTKERVATELPAKTEIVQSIPMEEQQRDLYDSIRLTMHKQIRQAVAETGIGRNQIAVLDALLKLRQCCCDPRLLSLDSAAEVRESAKLDALLQMLPSMVEEGRRILLFSQFTSMLALIEEAITALGIASVKLTGQTRDRAAVVEQFQQGDMPVFLISLKAGGTGLNLTAADTVIHYDPWWNPAAENQATDRAYRIGQDKPVFVYKLVTAGTVEEKILQLQARKQGLAEGLFGANTGEPTQLTLEDVEQLLQAIEE